jgi:hypothetical protein
VDNIVKDIRLYENKWLDHMWNEWIEAAFRGWLSSNNLEDGGIWEDQDEDGETKNSLA